MKLRALALFAAAAAATPSCTTRPDEPAPSRATSVSTPAAEAAAPLDMCATARKGLDDLIATADSSCAKDDDCGGYYLHEGACGGPTFIHRPGFPSARKPLLFANQAAVRKSCDAGAECAPEPYQAACRNGRCVDALAK